MASRSILDITNATDYRPKYVAQPDGRFATAFLSNDLRDYAVEGEALMDKSSGELFLKRPADGRVISFFQNKKYMDELMLEIRVLLNNNPNFTYPGEDRLDAVMTSTNYDVITMNDDQVRNALDFDTTLKGDGATQPYHRLKFMMSDVSNGFFIQVCSRDCDKPLINYLTTVYNAALANYYGTEEQLLNERNKFSMYNNWTDSNAVVHYTLIAHRATGTDYIMQLSAPVEMNAQHCVLIPIDVINEAISEPILSYEVEIKEITYDKINFMYHNLHYFEDEIRNEIERFIYPDRRVCINYINVITFVNKSTDILLNGNEFIVAMMDVPQVHRFLMRLSRLTESSSLLLSINQPNTDTWKTNGVWGEHIRSVGEDGETTVNPTRLTFDTLESYLANNQHIDEIIITTDESDYRNYLVKKEYRQDLPEDDPEAVRMILDNGIEGSIYPLDDEGNPLPYYLNHFEMISEATPIEIDNE